PNAIEDAIVATRSLAFRYLWVGRYCIPRDGAERHAQISNMDVIHAHAQVTLVAAAGEDADYGLPGVGSRFRFVQPHAEIMNEMVVSTLPHIKEALKDSRWMKRAWTYQEALLSRRLLIFTDHQVFYECRGTNCCESVEKPLQSLHTKDGQRLREFGEERLFPHNGLGKYPWDVATRIAEYSARTLSYDSDALEAMLGIFSAFTQRQDPGVPIVTTAKSLAYRSDSWRRWSTKSRGAQFATGLCWSHAAPARRRQGFPSWSWTGWVG
ncbi:HET-domain-containing protein, partial [Mytilinidion resinicola]